MKEFLKSFFIHIGLFLWNGLIMGVAMRLARYVLWTTVGAVGLFAVVAILLELGVIGDDADKGAPPATGQNDTMGTVAADTTQTVAAVPTPPASLASREVYGAGDVPNVRLDDRRRHVADPNGLLNAATRDTIDALLTELEDSTRHQVAVVMLPSIGDADLFDFSQELAEAWGLGRKGEDDGLLIVYVADKRTIRFHTGYGLEGVMTDARSKQIQTAEMAPRFKEGDTNGGMTAGVRAVVKALGEDETGTADSDDADGGDWIVHIFWLALLPIVAWGGRKIHDKTRRCPRCERRGRVRKEGSDTFEQDGKEYWKHTYACSLCGHRFVRTGRKYGDDDVRGTDSNWGGNVFSGGGSDGSSGGSWGGGSFGGGGASSSW